MPSINDIGKVSTRFSTTEMCYLSVANGLSASTPIVQELKGRVPECKRGDEVVAMLMTRLVDVQQQGEIGLEQLKCLSAWSQGEGADLVKSVEALLGGLSDEVKSFETKLKGKEK